MSFARIGLLLMMLAANYSITENVILTKDCYYAIMQWIPLRKDKIYNTMYCVRIYKQYGIMPYKREYINEFDRENKN